MPFPFLRKPSPEAQLQQLHVAVRALTPFIGGYPPRMNSPRQAKQIVQQWQQANDLAERLFRDHPQSLELRLTFADLLRMGHNIDQPGAAKVCAALLEEILRITPDHFRANYILASLYVTLKPTFAPLAEAYFLKAEQARPFERMPDIYQGLGFACLAQQKMDEAVTYFEQYLQLGGTDPDIQTLVTHLRAGKTPQIITYE
jgi:tetratricopeptide (TPR) repeat protein